MDSIVVAVDSVVEELVSSNVVDVLEDKLSLVESVTVDSTVESVLVELLDSEVVSVDVLVS